MAKSPIIRPPDGGRPFVNIQLLPKQIAMVGYDERQGAARGGYGSGKSVGWSWWLYKRMRKFPRSSFYVGGASFVQLRRGFFKTFTATIRKLGWQEGIDYRYQPNPSPKVTFLHGGAVLESLSAEQADTVHSIETQTLYCEEPQTWGPGGQEFYAILTKRVRHTQESHDLYPDLVPQIRLSFNPPAIGHWLHTMCEDEWPKEGFKCFQLSLRENTLLQDQAGYIKQVVDRIAPERVPAEIDGEWGTASTGTYHGFDVRRNTLEGWDNAWPDGLPSFGVDTSRPWNATAPADRRPLAWCLDFNVGWMASLVGQWFEQTMVEDREPREFMEPKRVLRPLVPGFQRRIYYGFQEIFMPNTVIQKVCERFVGDFGAVARIVGVRLYGDATGGNRSQVGDVSTGVASNWDAVKLALKTAGIPFEMRVPLHQPPVINTVNAQVDQFNAGDGIAPGTGVGYVLRRERMKETVKDFQLVTNKPGTNEILKDNSTEEGRMRTHLSDASRYMVWFERAYDGRKKRDDAVRRYGGHMER
jgi:hypothetical protein